MVLPDLRLGDNARGIGENLLEPQEPPAVPPKFTAREGRCGINRCGVSSRKQVSLVTDIGGLDACFKKRSAAWRKPEITWTLET